MILFPAVRGKVGIVTPIVAAKQAGIIGSCLVSFRFPPVAGPCPSLP